MGKAQEHHTLTLPVLFLIRGVCRAQGQGFPIQPSRALRLLSSPFVSILGKLLSRECGEGVSSHLSPEAWDLRCGGTTRGRASPVPPQRLAFAFGGLTPLRDVGT